MLERPQREALGDRAHQLLRRHALAADRQLAVVRARDQQEVLGEAGQPLRLLGDRRGRRLLELRPRPGRRSASSSSVLKQCQRRPQLVTRVGDEAALVLERRCSRASISFSVRASARDLVTRGGHRQRLPGVVAVIARRVAA